MDHGMRLLSVLNYLIYLQQTLQQQNVFMMLYIYSMYCANKFLKMMYIEKFFLMIEEH